MMQTDTSATRTSLPSPAAAGSKSVTIGAGDRPLLIAELMPMAQRCNLQLLHRDRPRLRSHGFQQRFTQ